MTGWKHSGGKVLSVEDEIEGLKRTIEELHSVNCNKAADILCEEFQRLQEEISANERE